MLVLNEQMGIASGSSSGWPLIHPQVHLLGNKNNRFVRLVINWENS